MTLPPCGPNGAKLGPALAHDEHVPILAAAKQGPRGLVAWWILENLNVL